MPKTDPRIDAYIAKAGEFARPILSHLREVIRAACPEVAETIKWSAPFYEYKGILAATPSFKSHCKLVLWQRKLVFKDFPAKDNPDKKFRKLTSLNDLPSDKVLIDCIKRAVALNESGAKTTAKPKPKKKPLEVPDYFLAALKKNKKAAAAFGKFSPSCQREYVEWIVEAKREETRSKRLATAIEWIAQGKSRNWKYEKC